MTVTFSTNCNVQARWSISQNFDRPLIGASDKFLTGCLVLVITGFSISGQVLVMWFTNGHLCGRRVWIFCHDQSATRDRSVGFGSLAVASPSVSSGLCNSSFDFFGGFFFLSPSGLAIMISWLSKFLVLIVKKPSANWASSLVVNPATCL